MPDFLTILSAYYLCSAISDDVAPTRKQAAMCSHAYHTAKLMFLDNEEQKLLVLTGGRLTSKMSEASDLRFKEWERENPEIVDQVKTSVLGQAA